MGFCLKPINGVISSLDDPIFYCAHPIHLVEQKDKEEHKIRVYLDFTSSVNKLYFQGKLLLPGLDLTTTAWHLANFFYCFGLKRFFFVSVFSIRKASVYSTGNIRASHFLSTSIRAW